VPYCLEVLVNNIVSTLLWSVIAFQLLLKRLEDVSEEACDADGIYVILRNQFPQHMYECQGG